MKPSPLEFAREFEKLKSDLSRLPSADLRLFLLVRFWEQLAPVAGKSAYESYLNDYRSLVIGLVQADALSDLTIDSLNRVRRVLDDLVAVSGVDSAPPELRAATSTVISRLANLYFYVGAVDEGLALCLELNGGDDLALPADSEIRGLSPLDTLRVLYDKYRRDYPELSTLLQGILAQWEEDALAVEHDRVWCLFVDKEGQGYAATGRMRLLRGTVEQVAAKRKSSSLPDLIGPPDQVAFDNQVKTPDDPFIGVAYDSLKAVRTGLRSAGFAQRAEGSYRAFLSIDGSNRTFTGDSIGLAVALVAFTQLLKPEVMRQERFIASDIAVTGSITADGRITPVNNDSIVAKIERAFFSHVRYVVLPEANLASARDTVKRLSKQYPRRKLRLVSAAHLDDVLNDRNIIRSEKVCFGAFITKKAARYSRATKVQVPLLLGLIWLLLAVLWPQYFDPWFDDNPQYVRLTERGFEALNKDSIPVWDVEYECDSITSKSKWEIRDLDGDGKNEVAFVPEASKTLRCGSNANLFVYDCDGDLLFQRYCAKDDEYPGTQPPCGVNPVGVEKVGGRTIIITGATRSFPARLYLMFWNPEGDLLGWYINAGYGGAFGSNFLRYSDSQFVFLGYNNRMESACLYVLEPYSSYGVSPPYTDPNIDLDNVKRGNQMYYVLFPRSDLNNSARSQYNYPSRIVAESDSINRADISALDSRNAYVSYYLNHNFRVIDVKVDDAFIVNRNTLVSKELLPPIDWSSYLARMRDMVIYWTDSGWVTEGELRAAEKR